MTGTGRSALAGMAASLWVGLVACSGGAPGAEPVPTAPVEPAPSAQAASLAKLATLEIKGRAPKTGYDRSQFGESWTDDVTVAGGHNGCDTRNDILRRDLTDIEIKPDSNGCAVLSGTLHDPYSGATVAFRRGPGTSAEVQIDHLVALSDAWQKGAQQWDVLKRRDFANDPINLQATVGAINQQKGDGDAATWLPPNRTYRCTYVSRIVDVKAAYGLWVTQAEHDAIAGILQSCPTPPGTPMAGSAGGPLGGLLELIQPEDPELAGDHPGDRVQGVDNPVLVGHHREALERRMVFEQRPEADLQVRGQSAPSEAFVAGADHLDDPDLPVPQHRLQGGGELLEVVAGQSSRHPEAGDTGGHVGQHLDHRFLLRAPT